jgi:glycosyltransferase involved in cell wall biosynthesis
MNKSCFIFFYEGYVGVSPTVANTTKILAQNGYLVNIYGTKNKYPAPGDLGDEVKIFYFKKGANKLQFLKKIGLKKWIPAFQGIIYILTCLIQIFRTERAEVRENHINIGVDVYGSIAALLSFYLFKQKFLFLSLEFRDEFTNPEGLNKIIYSLAKLACRKSEGVMIQDEDRFEILCNNYEYRHPQVFYLPNSPVGAKDDSSEVSTGNYFREKFNLNPEQFPYIIVQAGMIDDTVLAKPLAQAFASIDNGCALIFHDRFPKPPEDPYINSLKKMNSKNLFISTDPVPYDQVDKIFSSSTIGLAFYSGYNEDFSQIAMASGKLAHSFKLGRPVLVNDLPSLRRLIEKYRCGVVIKNPSDSKEIELGIDQILGDYETYCQNAKLCFEGEFDFAKKVKPILLFMEQIK